MMEFLTREGIIVPHIVAANEHLLAMMQQHEVSRKDPSRVHVLYGKKQTKR